MKHTKITTTTLMDSTTNNNLEDSIRLTKPWQSQSPDFTSNNNGENIVSNTGTSSNFFLEEERAASAIATGKTYVFSQASFTTQIYISSFIAEMKLVLCA